jgi:hypothetical protein
MSLTDVLRGIIVGNRKRHETTGTTHDYPKRTVK